MVFVRLVPLGTIDPTSLPPGLDEDFRDVPDGDGPRVILSARQQALLNATDELIKNRSISEGTWQQLAMHLDRRRLIEFCLLATQYDGLAATITALNIPLDNPR